MSTQNAQMKVGIGMSGGVDSSAAAALLLDQGYDVVGLTAHMWKGSRCCSIEDVQRAAKVADFLGIPHETVNTVHEFGRLIMEPFVDEYARGRTPSPCITCNEYIKFGVVAEAAIAKGCTHFATGHYARVEHRADGSHLLRAKDRRKDQSYFLHRLSQEQLQRTLLPLGDLTKPKVTEYVKQRGIPVTFRGESQDLCFVSNDGHAALVEKYRRAVKKQGEIVDTSGNVLGHHEGIHPYTVGQRKGIGIAAAEPLYVKEIVATTNTVVVGSRDEVVKDTCDVEHVHWMLEKPGGPVECGVRVRYRHEAAPAKVTPEGGDLVQVRFREPQFAITPGQAAVFFDGDEVLGGGWITG